MDLGIGGVIILAAIVGLVACFVEDWWRDPVRRERRRRKGSGQ